MDQLAEISEALSLLKEQNFGSEIFGEDEEPQDLVSIDAVTNGNADNGSVQTRTSEGLNTSDDSVLAEIYKVNKDGYAVEDEVKSTMPLFSEMLDCPMQSLPTRIPEQVNGNGSCVATGEQSSPSCVAVNSDDSSATVPTIKSVTSSVPQFRIVSVTAGASFDTNSKKIPRKQQQTYLPDNDSIQGSINSPIIECQTNEPTNNIDLKEVDYGIPEEIVDNELEKMAVNGAGGNVIPSASSVKEVYYQCDFCGSKFMDPVFFRKHSLGCKKESVKVDDDKIPLFICSLCKKTFPSIIQIKQHIPTCGNNSLKRKHHSLLEEHTGKQKRMRIEGSLTDADDDVMEALLHYKCQDCDRTFSKERQYKSHIRRCTKESVHKMTDQNAEVEGMEMEGQELVDQEPEEDPFADASPCEAESEDVGSKKDRPAEGEANPRLFDGEELFASTPAFIVADNEALVRSSTGLAHTVQMAFEDSKQDGLPAPIAVVTSTKGVRGRKALPKAWSMVCPLCDKLFLTIIALANHIVGSHGVDLNHQKMVLTGGDIEGGKLYRCPLCDLRYDSEANILEHLVLQHSNKLQDTFAKLHEEKSSCVCSLCSIVLGSKKLVMEHVCLNHLDELQAVASNAIYAQLNNGGNLVSSTKSSIKADKEAENCVLCGDDLDEQAMMSHYTEVHGISSEGRHSLLDLGVDVDVRVKDTRRLMALVDEVAVVPKMPRRTVLVGKRPQKSWQCGVCDDVFRKHVDYIRHTRNVCVDTDQSVRIKENDYKCFESGCEHLAFRQVKKLFKHKEEFHKIFVPKKTMTFENLLLFTNFLLVEEKLHNVHFEPHNVRIVQHSFKTMQLVCQEYLHAKNKLEIEDQNNTNKISNVRIFAPVICMSFLYLRIMYNSTTKNYDGETSLLYYPQHSHEEKKIYDTFVAHSLEHKFKVLGNYGSDEKVNKPPTFSGGENGLAPVEIDASQSTHFVATPSAKVATPSIPIPQKLTALTSYTISAAHKAISPMSSTLKRSPATALANASTPMGSPATVLDGQKIQMNGRTYIVRCLPGASPLPVPQVESSSVEQYLNNFCQTELQGTYSEEALPLVVGSQRVADDQHMEEDTGNFGQYTENEECVLASGDALPEIQQDSTVCPENIGETHDSTVWQENIGEAENSTVWQENPDETATDGDYVLPANDEEWKKMFSAMHNRLLELDMLEAPESDRQLLLEVLSYENLVDSLVVQDQAALFQQMCLLSGTSVEYSS